MPPTKQEKIYSTKQQNTQQIRMLHTKEKKIVEKHVQTKTFSEYQYLVQCTNRCVKRQKLRAKIQQSQVSRKKNM